ncbi:MAG: hypothetical protein CMH75_06785 [Nitrospina sp.]|nr:hypothetical protein [Nitrospina sp.]|tara:strand:- start:758 stop:961 length:204 start_codon:yes stop_codon:yes gene_type:complete
MVSKKNWYVEIPKGKFVFKEILNVRPELCKQLLTLLLAGLISHFTKILPIKKLRCFIYKRHELVDTT